MTSLGSPGLSSQSVSGFSSRKGRKYPKRTVMTSLGSPGLSAPIPIQIFRNIQISSKVSKSIGRGQGKSRFCLILHENWKLQSFGRKNHKSTPKRLSTGNIQKSCFFVFLAKKFRLSENLCSQWFRRWLRSGSFCSKVLCNFKMTCPACWVSIHVDVN